MDLSAFYEKSNDEYELLIEDPGFNERKKDWPQIHEFNGKTIENSYISRMNSNNDFPDIVKSDIT